MRVLVAIVLILFGIVLAGTWGTMRWWTEFTAHRDCIAYIDRAAHAPTLDIAETALKTGVEAAQARGWDRGNTGVIWTQTYNDVGFWFTNLQACQRDIEAARKEGTQLAASNTMMRMKETLSRFPESIETHPNNAAWLVSGWIVWPIALIFGTFGVILLLLAIE